MSDSLFKTPHDEARARIMWGESPAEVTRWLIGEGLTQGQAKALLRDIKEERSGEVRRTGFRRIWTGLLLMLVGFGLLVAMSIPHVHWITAYVFAVGLSLVGLYRLITGIFMLLSGRASGSLTDLD